MTAATAEADFGAEPSEELAAQRRGELRALSRKWSARRTAEMLAFHADSFGVVELGRAVAVEYGRLRAAAEALGRPVASNDLWIAASATANGQPLVT